jgi:hypothetical protein
MPAPALRPRLDRRNELAVAAGAAELRLWRGCRLRSGGRTRHGSTALPLLRLESELLDRLGEGHLRNFFEQNRRLCLSGPPFRNCVSDPGENGRKIAHHGGGVDAEDFDMVRPHGVVPQQIPVSRRGRVESGEATRSLARCANIAPLGVACSTLALETRRSVQVPADG